MQNIKVFIVAIVLVDFPVFLRFVFFFFFTVCLWLPLNSLLCCYSLNGFIGCILGCVTLATLVPVRGTWLNTFIYIWKDSVFVLFGEYNGDIPVHIFIIVQTYLWTLNSWNVCQIYFVEFVSKIEHILLVIHYSINGAVCFQFIQFPRGGWENILICLIIITESEVWTIIHCLGLGHETMVCAVCFFVFLQEQYDYIDNIVSKNSE